MGLCVTRKPTAASAGSDTPILVAPFAHAAEANPNPHESQPCCVSAAPIVSRAERLRDEPQSISHSSICPTRLELTIRQSCGSAKARGPAEAAAVVAGALGVGDELSRVLVGVGTVAPQADTIAITVRR